MTASTMPSTREDRRLIVLFVRGGGEPEERRAWLASSLMPELLRLPGAANAQAFEIASTKPLPGTRPQDFGDAVVLEVAGAADAANASLQERFSDGVVELPAGAELTQLVYEPVSREFASERLACLDDTGRRHAMLIWSERPLPSDEYDTWYDEVHIADFLAAPGVVRAQRFVPAATPALSGAAVPALGHLAYYEVDGSLDRVREEIKAQLMDGRMVLPSFMPPPFDALFLSPLGRLSEAGAAS